MSMSEVQLRSAQLAAKVGTLARELKEAQAMLQSGHPGDATALGNLVQPLETLADRFDAIAFAQASAPVLTPTPAGA